MAVVNVTQREQLRALEARVSVALAAASAARPPAPEALRDLLVDALARLQLLTAGSDEHTDAVESVERALAALQAWQRWRPSTQPSG
jgi:hypothetical protein